MRLAPDVGSRCLVIGGCGGIGLAYVAALAAAGSRVAVVDIEASLAATRLPEGVLSAAIDTGDDRSLPNHIARIGEAWGGFDVFAYVSGINIPITPVETTPLAAFRQVLDVNLVSAFVAAQAAIPYLRRAPAAAVVFVASGLYANAEAGFGAYCASKGGMVSLMKVLAKEGAPGIRCNAVAPGLVETAFLTGGTGQGGVSGASGAFLESLGAQGERIRASIPLGRIATPADVVGPMLFLSGPASAYLTGQVIYVNGGRFSP